MRAVKKISPHFYVVPSYYGRRVSRRTFGTRPFIFLTGVGEIRHFHGASEIVPTHLLPRKKISKNTSSPARRSRGFPQEKKKKEKYLLFRFGSYAQVVERKCRRERKGWVSAYILPLCDAIASFSPFSNWKIKKEHRARQTESGPLFGPFWVRGGGGGGGRNGCFPRQERKGLNLKEGRSQNRISFLFSSMPLLQGFSGRLN